MLGSGQLFFCYPLRSLIFSPESKEIRGGGDDGKTDHAHEERVPGTVVGCIPRQESKRRNDAAEVAEADLPSGADTTGVVTLQVHGEPAYDDRHGCIDTHGQEKEGAILSVNVVVDTEEDGGTADAEGQWDEDEDKAVLQPVRDKSNEHREDKGDGERRDGVQLGGDWGVAICSDDGGRKVCEALRALGQLVSCP